MARKQKHYTDEKMILKDIEKAQRRSTRLRKKAESLDDQAADLFKSENAGDIEKAKQLREEAELHRDKAERITNTRLPRLQDTLAAFRTELLPGVSNDPSVVLQRKRK